MTDTPEIPPALTPEQWRRKEIDGAYLYAENAEVGIYAGSPESSFMGRERHALAALCLYGQPFGPKAEWLTTLTLLSRREMEQYEDEALREIYAFLAALLPPTRP